MIRRGGSQFMSLLEQEKRILQAEEFSTHERELLRKLNDTIAGVDTLAAVMEHCARTLRAITPCDRIELILVDEDSGRLYMQWLYTSYDDVRLLAGQFLPAESCSLQRALESDKPLVINDLPSHALKHADDRVCQLLKGEGLMSRMMCPLEVEGKRIGMLGLSSHKQYAYGFHQIRIFEVFGPRFSQAVQKVHQIEQLQAANSSYLEALGFISHELKSPLASMVMEARLLQQGYVGELSEEQQQRIAKIANKAQYMIGLIRDYLDLARLETGELQARPLAEVNLRKDVVDPAVELANAYLERFKVSLENGCPADMPAVMCDPRLLVVALSNLLSNAAKYGREGGKARIIVDNSSEGFSISVWNKGEGFNDEQRQRLFQKFSRLHSPGGQQRKGTGVGLYSVRRIAQLHGGTVSASSDPGQWAQFTLFVPQPLICVLPG